MPDPKIINPEAIAALRDLNPGDNDVFLMEIIGIYVEDTPMRLTELKKSLAAGETALFTRAAHTIKGSSANLGAIAGGVFFGALSQRIGRRRRDETHQREQRETIDTRGDQ